MGSPANFAWDAGPVPETEPTPQPPVAPPQPPPPPEPSELSQQKQELQEWVEKNQQQIQHHLQVEQYLWFA